MVLTVPAVATLLQEPVGGQEYPQIPISKNGAPI